jgi:allophanate hydrolase
VCHLVCKPEAPTISPSLDLVTLRRAYRSGDLSPVAVVRGLVARIARHRDNPIWISLVPEDALVARAEQLARDEGARERLPLYGVPFAVKDNIDVAGLPTTAACREFAYTPARTATAVERLLEAGAILVGKTNLDQFATGLVGTRSPYGAVRNAFDPAYVSGGSSSGSAVAVALGLASFALGTDTAGSGRVPAGFNNVVGLKPTRGIVSTAGVVPACRTLDCVSVFALTCGDARAVLDVLDAQDPADAFARDDRAPAWKQAGVFRFGVPRDDARQFFGDDEYGRLLATAIGRLRSLGGEPVEVDLAPFFAAAELLYGGPWIAERYAAVRAFFDAHAGSMDPVTRAVIGAARNFSAADAFDGAYRLAALRRETRAVWDAIDLLLVPTAGRIYRIAEIAADPLRLNANLGRYTNFVNLLDLAAIAVPSGFRADGLPFGVTFVAPARHDRWLALVGERYHRAAAVRLGATDAAVPQSAQEGPPDERAIRIAVVGAHLSGQPLNHQLTGRSATLVRTCRTAPMYRLYALPGTEPPKPGLVREAPGAAIEVEIWEMPALHYGAFVAAIPAPLGIGTVELGDGSRVQGFLCESYATRGARDISSFGGWRAYLASPRGDTVRRTL